MDEIKELINKVLHYKNEYENIDFKEKMYDFNISQKKIDFIKDIVAMATSSRIENKYIIIGIKESVGEFECIGIKPELVKKPSDYQQLIRENVEPNINFTLEEINFDGKLLGCFIISGNNNRPYMLRKDFEKLAKGDCFIRVNSSQSKVTRMDLDNFYSERIEYINSTLRKLNYKKIELSRELLLIYLLKKNFNYIVETKNTLIREVNDCLEALKSDKSFMRKLNPGSFPREVLSRAKNSIMSFSVKELNLKSIYEILVECRYDYYEEYINVLTEIEFGYNKLKKYEQIICGIALHQQDDEYKDDSTWRAELEKIYDFNLIRYFGDERFELLIKNFNVEDRITYLEAQLNDCYMEIENLSTSAEV